MVEERKLFLTVAFQLLDVERIISSSPECLLVTKENVVTLHQRSLADTPQSLRLMPSAVRHIGVMIPQYDALARASCHFNPKRALISTSTSKNIRQTQIEGHATK